MVHSCSICTKTFTRRDNLLRHLRNVHRMSAPSIRPSTHVQMSSLVSKCFGTPTIMQTILENTCLKDPIEQRHLRLVSKSFNSEYLHWIRRTHRTVTIQKSRRDKHKIDEETFFLFVNSHELTNFRLQPYCRFLVEVAGVRIEKLRLTRQFTWLNNKDLNLTLHQCIMDILVRNQNLKELIAGEPICEFGCSECQKHALRCSVYGPIQLSILLNAFTHPHHYEKLIVSKRLLDELAELCARRSRSRAECLEVMNAWIPPLITCSHLSIILSESSPSLPRELIEHMCRKWRVKSIGVEFDTREESATQEWRGFFTTVRFTDPYLNVAKSQGLRFDYVDVDVESGLEACCEVTESPIDGRAHFSNLIANVRRVFPTNRVFFQGCSTILHSNDGNERLFDNIVAFCLKDQPNRHLEVTFRFFYKMPDRRLSIPLSFSSSNRQFTTERLPAPNNHTSASPWNFSAEYVGEAYRLTDKAASCVINLERYFNKDQLAFMRRKLKERKAASSK